jgi:hypothetical protein
MNAVRSEEPIEGSLVSQEPRQAVTAMDSSPAGMIAYAMRTNASIAELRELYAFKKEWEADEAKKAFHRAVAAFKENPPTIVRDKENKQFNSRYSSLANTVNKTNEALAQHGLNATWELKQDDKVITVTCILSHEQGHSERVTFSAPPDTSGGNSKNPIQQMKSTVTYLRGVTFEAVTGVVTSEAGINVDDDGNGAGQSYDASDWYAAIDGASSVDELNRLAGELKTAEIPKAALKDIRAAWAKRAKELKS